MNQGHTINTLIKEPLFHFIFFGLLIFMLDALLNEANNKDVIVVNTSSMQYLQKQQEELLNRKLNAKEIESLTQNYIDQEVLLREAYDNGLDSDMRIREQLIKKMRTLLMEESPEPTLAELKHFYTQNAKEYQVFEQVSLEHVFYKEKQSVPSNFLDLIQTQEHFKMGDFNALIGYKVKAISQDELSRLMAGSGNIAQEVFSMPINVWSSPLKSKIGYHFFKVTDKKETYQMPFEEVKSYIQEDYKLYQSQQGMENKLLSLREKYKIIINTPK